MDTSVNRRQFLSRTVAATAGCGIVGRGIVADAAAKSAKEEINSLVDTHVYLGDWPHAHLNSEAPRELVASLRQHKVTQAWVGSFEGLFHKDIAAINSRLADSCSRHGDGMLIPFGTVNPTLPDWEDDLRRCHEKHHMPGIRLYPGYHGYALADSRFAELLSLAAKAKLIVQLVVWLDDAKHRWLTPATDNADLKPTAVQVAQDGQSHATHPHLMILGSRPEDISSWNSAFSQADISFDVSRFAASSKQVDYDVFSSSERIVFGSGTPLRSLQSLSNLLAESDITDDRRQAIVHKLAAKLVDSH